jgi:LacI family transcriptional regulator
MAFDDIATIRALTKAGLNVLADCSVLGFDDVTTASFYNPPRTTVHQPMEMSGSPAATILIREVEDSLKGRLHRSAHREIKPCLVIRESTCAPGQSKRVQMAARKSLFSGDS